MEKGSPIQKYEQAQKSFSINQKSGIFLLTNQRPKALNHRPTPQLRPMNGLRQHTALKTMREYNCTSSTGCVAQNTDRVHQLRPLSPTSTMIVQRKAHKPTRKDMAKCRMLNKIAGKAKNKKRGQDLMTTNEMVIQP